MILKILLIFTLILLIILLLYILLRLTLVCNGGDLVTKDCGKVLFPWVKKFKLPSGKYCCLKCYLRDIQTFTDIMEDGKMETQKIQVKPENEKAIIESMNKDGWKIQTKEVNEDGSCTAVFIRSSDGRIQLND